MTSITAEASLAARGLGQLDSRNVRLQRLPDEEVQQVLTEIAALKANSQGRATVLGRSAGSDEAAAQTGSAVVAAETGSRAQQIAQEGSVAAAMPDDGEEESAAVKAFLDYMSKTPEERYFEAFLSSKGMTQEEYDALPAEDKKALMKEFEEFVKQSVENYSAEKVARTSRSELL